MYQGKRKRDELTGKRNGLGTAIMPFPFAWLFDLKVAPIDTCEAFAVC